ncbi:MAG: hypothetical protein SF029_00855 [bacterium]|nr:hypothetical protein [bacterium]
MAIDLCWQIEHRVVLITISGDIILEDIGAAEDALWNFVKDGHQPVHVIFDVRRISSFPMNLRQIRERFKDRDRTGIGWRVLIIHHSMARLLAVIVFQLLNVPFRIVRSPAEALAFLLEQDDTLRQSV